MTDKDIYIFNFAYEDLLKNFTNFKKKLTF